MSKLGDEPAYPSTIDGVEYPGMTKREKIAETMTAELVLPSGFDEGRDIDRGKCARVARMGRALADALLTELAMRQEEASDAV